MAFLPGITTTALEGRIYAIAGQAMWVERDGGRARVPRGVAGEADRYMGELAGEPCFAREAGDAPPGDVVPLRQLFGTIADEEFGVAGRALGLTAWDRDHRHCGRCGAPTARSTTERMRTCTRCGHGARYPRGCRPR